jgi:Na+-transporting NADH:ubiquinone oxidoreductase subunit F
MQIFLGSSIFTLLIMALALAVLGARSGLAPRGVARILINNNRIVNVQVGENLLTVLEHAGVRLPSSCGGRGTCGLCRVSVSGAGEVSPIERAALTSAEIENNVRLACQVAVRDNLEIELASELLVVDTWTCVVSRTRTVAPLIKEILLTLPEGKARSFLAGSYVQITAPPFVLAFADIAVDSQHEQAWDRLGLRRFVTRSKEQVSRAYSLANHPGEIEDLLLNIRLALPPGNQPSVSPGIVSSYLFGLSVGDQVEVSGPFGHFFISNSDREIILIGGGVGMAPLRAHAFDQLEYRKTSRRMSFWYGARSQADLYYVADMERLAQEHENFSWHLALSAPIDDWNGKTGFIHDVLYDDYLNAHPDPTACEYYLCGPPLMIEAIYAQLDRLGVPRAQILHDDFGS